MKNNLRNLLLIFLAALVITLPFIDQPYHIDDHLFIFMARSISKNILLPYNFYFPAEDRIRRGFEGFTNPPLNSYFIYLISRFFGEKAVILHSFFIVFAVFTAFSLYFLSQLFVKNAFFVTCLAITTPVFMLQSHSLMPDIALLGLCCMAVYFYIRGLDENKKKFLLISSLFASLALLTRYNGLLLVPLLFIYARLKKKNFRAYFLYLLIPLLVFLLWCLLNMLTYGKIHILSPIIIAKTFFMSFTGILPRAALHFIYIGSLMIFPVCFAWLFLLKERREAKKYRSIAFILFLFNWGYFLSFGHTIADIIFYSYTTSFCFLFFVWIIKSWHELKADSASRNSFSDDLFLFIWIFMLIIFHSSVYFIAPKFILLLIPPVLFLLFRLLEKKYINFIAYSKKIILVSFTLGFLICESDYLQAVFDKNESSKILNEYSKKMGKTVWFIDEDRNWGQSIPYRFNAIYNKHNFIKGDLILGTPFYYKEILTKNNQYSFILKTIYYKAPLFNICDAKNNIYLYYDNFGRFLPYSVSFKKADMFTISQVALKTPKNSRSRCWYPYMLRVPTRRQNNSAQRSDSGL